MLETSGISVDKRSLIGSMLPESWVHFLEEYYRPSKISHFRMEYHIIELKKACRVCGKRVNKAKGRERSYLVAEHGRELADIFCIDTSSDSEDIHPLSFCHPCRTFMRLWHTRGSNAPSVGRVFEWAKHSEHTCMVSE